MAAPLAKTPTFHGALAANGLKRAYLIQFSGQVARAAYRDGSFDRLVRGVHQCFRRRRAHEGLIPVTSLTTSPPLARALAERNFDSLTPVQTAVLANDATGRDLLVSAQTGTGKIVAYGLAIANELLGD